MKQETTDFGRQLKALLKRNVLLKRREPIQTLFVSLISIIYSLLLKQILYLF